MTSRNHEQIGSMPRRKHDRISNQTPHNMLCAADPCYLSIMAHFDAVFAAVSHKKVIAEATYFARTRHGEVRQLRLMQQARRLIPCAGVALDNTVSSVLQHLGLGRWRPAETTSAFSSLTAVYLRGAPGTCITKNMDQTNGHNFLLDPIISNDGGNQKKSSKERDIMANRLRLRPAQKRQPRMTLAWKSVTRHCVSAASERERARNYAMVAGFDCHKPTCKPGRELGAVAMARRCDTFSNRHHMHGSVPKSCIYLDLAQSASLCHPVWK